MDNLEELLEDAALVFDQKVIVTQVRASRMLQTASFANTQRTVVALTVWDTGQQLEGCMVSFFDDYGPRFAAMYPTGQITSAAMFYETVEANLRLSGAEAEHVDALFECIKAVGLRRLKADRTSEPTDDPEPARPAAIPMPSTSSHH